MAATLRSRAYVAHHGYQRQLRVCTPIRHVARAGFAEGAAATGAPNTQPEAAEEVAQLRTKLAAAEAKLAQATAQAKLTQATSLKTKLLDQFIHGAFWLLVVVILCAVTGVNVLKLSVVQTPITAMFALAPILKFTKAVDGIIDLAVRALLAKPRDE